MKQFYLTTPIFYVNDRPHIGHAYTTIASDVVARYHHLLGEQVLLSTGTDENSQKTTDAAAKAGEAVAAYTDRMAQVWRHAWDTLGIEYTRFIRTTEEAHTQTVYAIWKRVADRGDIYKGTYEGLYCVGHEAFMKESDLVGGLCPDHKRAPERIKEENYFFRLSRYQSSLLDFYSAHPDFVMPPQRFHEIKRFVEDGLEDISISRPSKGWGIPVPGDPEQVIYVWFDALVNYISAIGLAQWERHPADVHMVGKDITRFHAVIWPAMLLSAGVPLPRQIGVNGFFTTDGVKISKSLGNAIDPLALAAKYGNDALRYFLLREIPYGEDGDFSFAKFAARYESDLANGLGNFAARVSGLSEGHGWIRKGGNIEGLETSINETKSEVDKSIKQFRFHHALASIMGLISTGDFLINENRLWEKGKNNDPNMYYVIRILEASVKMIRPFLPNTAQKTLSAIEWNNKDEVLVKKIGVLFPRLEK